MGDVTAGCKFTKAIGPQGIKKLYVETASTVDTGDTFTVTMSQYGLGSFMGITGWTHTTANSVVVGEAPTTSVTSGVLTVTVGGSGANNQIRLYEILFK